MALQGMEVEAIDGAAGKVRESISRKDASYIVVDTDGWLHDRLVYIPAGCILGIDRLGDRVRVGLTKDQIEASPEFDEGRGENEEPFVDLVAGYYSPILGPKA
jgi:hypothetical protein